RLEPALGVSEREAQAGGTALELAELDPGLVPSPAAGAVGEHGSDGLSFRAQPVEVQDQEPGGLQPWPCIGRQRSEARDLGAAVVPVYAALNTPVALECARDLTRQGSHARLQTASGRVETPSLDDA